MPTSLESAQAALSWVLAEPVRIQAELLRMRAHPRQRRLRGLLHHVTELAGDREPSLARVGGRLEEEDVAAHRGERESGRNPRIGRALAHFALEPPRAQPAAH